MLTVVAFVLVGVLGWATGYAQTYLSSWIGERMLYDLRIKLFSHFMALELGYHERASTGRSVSRLTSDVEQLNDLVTDGFTSVVVNGLTFIGVVIILFVYDWRLALLSFVVFPFLAVGTAWFRVASAKAYRRTRETVADVLTVLQENLAGVRVVQGFGRQEPAREAFRRANADYREANMQTIRLSGIYFPSIELLSGIGLAIVLYFGSIGVLDHQIQIGVMVAFIGYLASFFDPIQQLSQIYDDYQSSMAALEKIQSVFDTTPALADPPDAPALPHVQGDRRPRPRHVRVRARRSGDPRRHAAHQRRRDGRVGRCDRRRQVHARQAHRPPVRPAGGRGPHRRPRAALGAPGIVARAARHRAAGGTPVCRHPAREPDLRTPGRHRTTRSPRHCRPSAVTTSSRHSPTVWTPSSTSAGPACRPASAS